MCPDTEGRQMKDLLTQVEREIRAGLNHGFFEMSIRGEIGREGRRQVTILSGKSHKFTVPADDLVR